jgi:Cysteine rich repeat
MSKARGRYLLMSIGCIATAIPVVAMAQQLPPGLPPQANNPAVQAVISACNGDVQKFCPAVVPGGGRIVRCLAANQDKLSQVCRDSMLKAREALGM